MGVTYVYVGTFYVEASEDTVYDEVQKIVEASYNNGGWVSDGGDTIEMERNGETRKDKAVDMLKEILKAIRDARLGAEVSGEVGIVNADDPSDYTLLTVKKNVLTVRKAKFAAPKKAKAAKKPVKKVAKKTKVAKKAKVSKAKPVPALVALKKKENEQFMHDVDQWFGNMAPGKEIPFKISDADHSYLRGIREEVVEAGGKVVAEKSLPKLAKKAWVDVISQMGPDMFDELATIGIMKLPRRDFLEPSKSQSQCRRVNLTLLFSSSERKIDVSTRIHNMTFTV